MSFEAILRNYQRINGLARSLINLPAFNEVNVLLPDPISPEPAFIRATSWLYCLYFEAGRTSIAFLCRLGETYTLIDRTTADRHIEIVRCLRTELHHNLGFEDSDQEARSSAESWRRNASGTALPATNDQWIGCYDRLVNDAGSFLNALDQVVRKLESDGDAGAAHQEEWIRRLNRNIPAAAFDPLIEDAKYRLGRESLKTVAFRNQHVQEWKKQIDILDDGFDFEFEATRLIEKTLLQQDVVVLPLTGNDITEALGIAPGPKIGLMLKEARRYFESTRCGKDDILTHLRQHALDNP